MINSYKLGREVLTPTLNNSQTWSFWSKMLCSVNVAMYDDLTLFPSDGRMGCNTTVQCRGIWRVFSVHAREWSKSRLFSCFGNSVGRVSVTDLLCDSWLVEPLCLVNWGATYGAISRTKILFSCGAISPIHFVESIWIYTKSILHMVIIPPSIFLWLSLLYNLNNLFEQLLYNKLH